MSVSELVNAGVRLFGLLGGASIIAGIILRRFDQFEKKLDKREKDRVQENVVTLDLLTNCANLTEANLEKLRELSDPDACEPELSKLRESKEQMYNFVRTKSAEYLHTR